MEEHKVKEVLEEGRRKRASHFWEWDWKKVRELVISLYTSKPFIVLAYIMIGRHSPSRQHANKVALRRRIVSCQ